MYWSYARNKHNYWQDIFILATTASWVVFEFVCTVYQAQGLYR